MKKFLALMALLLCFMVLFVACDNNDEPNPTEKPTEPVVVPAGCEHAYDNACDADCNLCGEKRATAAHVEETVAAVAPTCTKAGLTEGKVCTVCGVVTKAQAVDPATGHTEVAVPGVAATCTKSGLTDGTACSVCKAVVKAQEVIFATGHNVEVVEGKAATCTQDGLTSGKQCSVCEEWVQEQAVIAKTGHKEVKNQSVAATCTKPGYVGATVCGICGEVLEGQETEKALGHNVVDIPAVPSTCTEQGSADGKMCSRCGVVIIEPVLQKLANHTAKKVAGYAPTCTTAGLEDGSVCKDCGKVIKAQKIIPATHGELVDLAAKDPTCTEVGYTAGSKCSDCGAIVVAQTVLPNVHTYTYECDTHCVLCDAQRWDEPHHVMGTTKKGVVGCVYECGATYLDNTLVPATFASGEDLYNRVLRSGDGLSSAIKNGALSYNEEGYITVSGQDGNADPGMDHVIAVPFGPAWDGEGQSVTQRYLVLRYRTYTRNAELRFVTWNKPTMVVKNMGTEGEWKTVIVDLGDSADAGERIDIRCNINGNATDFSHIASFAALEDANLYANYLGEIVDGECPHAEYILIQGRVGTMVVCSYCYEAATPTTSHEGAVIHNAIDPTCPDFALVTDNNNQGVTVTGLGTGLDGASANFVLTSDVNFGKYMVVVYKIDTGSAFLGIGANGSIASYAEVAPEANKWAVCSYGATGVDAATELEIICNYAGLSSSVSIQAIYTFESEAAANAYAELLKTNCFHDVTAVNDLGQTVCDACGAIQGATSAWPLDLESGSVLTPEFVVGENWWDPGIAEYNYFYYAEFDHKLVIDYDGENISIIVNGITQWGEEGYASIADIKAGDKVEVKVERLLDENWNPLTDSCFFMVDKAAPGSENNPFELVPGDVKTPEFVLGTSMADPGVEEYYYKWVAPDDGKLILSELENIYWVKNGEWGEGYTVEVLKGDVVEITVRIGMDENWNRLTDPVTFSAEFDVVHRFGLNEDGSIGCNKGCHETYTPVTYTSGSNIYWRATELQTTVSGVTYTRMPCVDNGDYVTITGAGNDPAAALNASGIFSVAQGGAYEGGTPVIQRYLVMRVRTNAAFNLMYIVTYNSAAQQAWCNPVDIGAASQGEWATIVIDLFGDASAGFRVDIALNIGAAADTQTDVSHIVSFTTMEDAIAYSNQLGSVVDGECPHNGYTTTVTKPATCKEEGEQIIHCDSCDLTVTLPIPAGGHGTLTTDETGSAVCQACGAKSTPKTFQAYDALFDAVTAGDAVDAGAEGVTITGVGTGFVFGPNDTTRVQIKSETGYGKYVVVVYKSNYTDAGGASYLAIGKNDNSGFLNHAGGIVPSEGYRAYLYEPETGATGEGAEEINLLFHFGGNANSVTNILGVITFNTLEDAQLYTLYLNRAFGVA